MSQLCWARNPVWVTKDGKFMPISEMKSSHIAHSINLIDVKGTWRVKMLGALQFELAIREAINHPDQSHLTVTKK